MSGFDWHRSEERDRNAAARGQAVASAPQRLGAALDRIADALVNLTLERDRAAPAPDTPVGEPLPVADRETIARVEERLDSAIAMLRGVLYTVPEGDSPALEAPAGAPHDPPHHDG